jgi:hypothetical protein
MIQARKWQHLFHPGHDHVEGSKLATIMGRERHDHGQDGPGQHDHGQDWAWGRHDHGQDGPGQHDHGQDWAWGRLDHGQDGMYHRTFG